MNAPKASGGFSGLITQALKAGFDDLAYCLLVIAGATTALGLTNGGHGLENELFRWPAALVGAGAFAFIAAELSQRALRKFFGVSPKAS